jgi:DNA polymerase-3 subunit beta
MKFIVSSSALLRQTQAISGVLNANSPLPILENFLFEIKAGELVVSASDLESTMTASLKVESKEKGKIAVPARLLLDTLKTLPEQPLTFSVSEKNFQVEVSSDFGRYRLTGHDGEEFPRLPAMDKVASITLPADVLAEAVNKTIFAAGSDELRPVMSGVFCQLSPENLTFVATDGHRLVRYRRNDLRSAQSAAFVLPRKPLNLLKGSLPGGDAQVTIEYNESNAFFRFGQFHLICRLIDGKYPNYEAVIPAENPNKLTIDRESFLNSIRRVSVFSNKTTHQVRFKITGSELQVSAEDPDFNNEANERLTCSYAGEDMEIAFNARFLIDMLGNLSSDELLMEMSLPNRASLISPAADGRAPGEEVLMLVMPVMMG